MEPDLLLGIDVGTSSAKGVLLTADGVVVAEAASPPYPLHHPHPGWAEQDPADWWTAVVAVCRALGKSASLSRVAAVAVSGQGCACTLVDADGDLVRPAITWLDTRASAETEELDAHWGSLIAASNGNAVGTYNVEPKLLWLHRYEPDALARAAHVLTTTAWVNLALTGVAAMNLADGGILHAFDARSGTWNRELLTGLGLDPGLYPSLHPCEAQIGAVSSAAAEATGLPVGIPVVAGGEDSPAAALAIGVRQPGDAFLSMGTAAVVGLCLDASEQRPEPRLLSYPHVVPGVTIRSGSMSSAGAATAWWSREMRGVYGDAEGLSASAAASPPGANGLIFLPYLSGELHPINDPHARGVFFGLTLTTSAHDMARAILEGSAMAIRHNLDVATDGHAAPNVLRATGGPARSEPWCQAIADITGCRVEVVAGAGAPVGDALIAGVGIGLIPDLGAVLDRMVTITRVHEPTDDPGVRQVYAAQYGIFRRLYERLADEFRSTTLSS